MYMIKLHYPHLIFNKLLHTILHNKTHHMNLWIYHCNCAWGNSGEWWLIDRKLLESLLYTLKWALHSHRQWLSERCLNLCWRSGQGEIDISGRKTQVKNSHSWSGERLSMGHSRVVLGQEALISQPVSFLLHCCGWQIRPDRSEQSSLRSQRRRALS